MPLKIALFLLLSCSIASCAGGGSGGSLDEFSNEGSEPLNSKEATRYKQALIRCHKTGGTRIVKIDGVLRCF